MKTAKRWIVSAGACLLALTSMSVSFGQIPTAPIPEQNNDGLPLLTEPAPIDITPIAPMPTPDEPEDVPDPDDSDVPQITDPKPAAQPAPEPQAAQPAQIAQPTQPATVVQQATPMIRPIRPCQQCCDQCPAGAYYSPSPYYGQDTTPWWLNIRPVPYTPVGHEHHGMGHPGLPMGGHLGNDRMPRLAPIEPPFYQTRGPRDFYLDKPRPLGY